MYVIQRQPDGMFVTPPGSEHSYTNRLQDARVYQTIKAATRDLCPENETIRFVDSFDKRIMLRKVGPR